MWRGFFFLRTRTKRHTAMGRLHSITPGKKKIQEDAQKCVQNRIIRSIRLTPALRNHKNNEVSLVCVKKTDGQMRKSKQSQKFSASRRFWEFRCFFWSRGCWSAADSPASWWLWKEQELFLRLKSLTTALSINQCWLTRASSFTGVSTNVVPFSVQSFHFTLLYFTAKRCSESSNLLDYHY